MSINLLQKIIRFQSKQDNFMDILPFFNSKIKYLSYKLKYPEAETDFIIYLYELLKLISTKRFEKDNNLSYYINKCLKNKSIALFNKNFKDKQYINFTEELELFENISFKEKNDEYCDIIFKDLISSLRPKQKQVAFYKFYLHMSDAEIAKIFKISRQAVNKTERLALKNLRTMV